MYRKEKENAKFLTCWVTEELLFPSDFKCTQVDSSNVGYGGGHSCNHSGLVVATSTDESSHLDANASHIMKITSISAVTT